MKVNRKSTSRSSTVRFEKSIDKAIAQMSRDTALSRNRVVNDLLRLAVDYVYGARPNAEKITAVLKKCMAVQQLAEEHKRKIASL